MDWITLTRQQVESDALPSVCMACGGPATRRINQTFSWTPEWVQGLYLAAILPGVIAEYYLKKEMRVACPFCRAHENHWRKLVWVASTGWLLAFLLGGLGYLFGTMIGATPSVTLYTALAAGALGLITWLAVVIRLATTRIKATKITNDEITFQGVAEDFVRAIKAQQTKPVES